MTNIIKPQPVVVRTPLDEVGSLLNVDRIPGEELKDYAERLYSTYVKRSSSTYEGLLNGINRALGVTEKPIMEVNYRSIMQGSLHDANTTVTINSFQDLLSYTGVVDGTIVIATGSVFKDSSANWSPNRLKGFKLTIGTQEFEILSNSSNEAVIDGVMSGLIGENFSIQLDLADNSLTGLALRVDGHIYKIAENTNNTIYINSGNLLNTVDKDYIITAFNPKVEVTASKMYLYKEYINENNFQLDLEIDLRKDFKYHKGIVAEINKSYYFEAVDLTAHKDRYLSISLRKQSSEHIVTREIVPAARYFRLQNANIKEGSVSFSESSIFLREVNQDAVPQAKGNYWIEYQSGAVLVNTLPSGTKTASYIWNEFPYKVTYSPAIVNGMADEEVKDYLFSQVEMRLYENPKERFVPSHPTSDMLEYIAELLQVKPQTWGV